MIARSHEVDLVDTWRADSQSLSVARLDGRLILLWTETGGPPVKAPTGQGFGGQVIKSMIEQLKGRTRFDWRPEGLVCEITLQA